MTTENAMTVRQARLRQVIDAVASLKWAADQIERVGMDLDPSPAKVARDFAVRAYPTPGRDDREPWIESLAVDLDHARLIADGTNEHIASLNRPTREHGGIERVEVVSHWRWTLPDGTTITTAWQTHDTNEEQR